MGGRAEGASRLREVSRARASRMAEGEGVASER
jgi:hypothetical protein